MSEEGGQITVIVCGWMSEAVAEQLAREIASLEGVAKAEVNSSGPRWDSERGGWY